MGVCKCELERDEDEGGWASMQGLCAAAAAGASARCSCQVSSPGLKNGRHSFLPEATSPSRACPALYPVVHPSVALPLSGPDQPGPGMYRGLRKGLTRCSADWFVASTERRAAWSYFEAKNDGRQGTSETGTGARV